MLGTGRNAAHIFFRSYLLWYSRILCCWWYAIKSNIKKLQTLAHWANLTKIGDAKMIDMENGFPYSVLLMTCHQKSIKTPSTVKMKNISRCHENKWNSIPKTFTNEKWLQNLCISTLISFLVPIPSKHWDVPRQINSVAFEMYPAQKRRHARSWKSGNSEPFKLWWFALKYLACKIWQSSLYFPSRA